MSHPYCPIWTARQVNGTGESPVNSARSATQVGEDGKHAAVVVVGGLDHLGVHRGAAARHPGDGVGELSAVKHPVLEQVTDRARAVGEELAGIQLLDVPGDDEDRQAGVLGPRGERRPQALVGERRR
jgi:hypothetical protein